MNNALETQVLVIGGGPIGLTAGLLLAAQGIHSVVVDRRGRTSTHPKSRLVDAITMEIMRQLGVEQEVEATGLGPDWTEFNRWFDRLSGTEVARIYTPSFHTVENPISPSKPVMTTQDSVEAILFDRAAAHPLIDLRFNTEVEGLTQGETGVSARLCGVKSGEETECIAEYAIAADGVRSGTRGIIDAPLEADFMEIYFQDVIFHADFSAFMEGRKGGLLFIAHKMGAAVFQPLDGVRRWRCQIGGFPRDETITKAFAEGWIRSAIGEDAPVNGEIEVQSMTEWQFMPGRTSVFGRGRIFLAGDAAHTFIPAGGMGNNTGFVGIRNLTWKLAYVISGIAPVSLLDTYDLEHQRIAKQRVDTGAQTAALTAGIFRAFHAGEDATDAALRCAQYGNYNGVIFGYEVRSPLCAIDDEPPPQVEDPIRDFVPVVRSGRPAPHVWINEERGLSVLDGLGLDYVLLFGSRVAPDIGRHAAASLAEQGFPIACQILPPEAHPYSDDEVVLVRPDSIIADHWRVQTGEIGQMRKRLTEYLPWVGRRLKS